MYLVKRFEEFIRTIRSERPTLMDWDQRRLVDAASATRFSRSPWTVERRHLLLHGFSGLLADRLKLGLALWRRCNSAPVGLHLIHCRLHGCAPLGRHFVGHAGGEGF
jgi:hypothetical protein